MLETQIIILVVLIFLSAFLSGIETALMSTTMIKVKSLVRQKKKGAETLHRLKQNPHKLIITILIGNNLVNISAASLATVVFTNLFGSAGIGMATGVMTFLILVFGEITPKTFAAQNAQRVSLIVARPIELLSYVLMPLVLFFELIAKGMSKLMGSKKEKHLSEEELKTIVTMGQTEGILDKEIAAMIHNLLEFEGTKVKKVMTRNIDMHVLDGNQQLSKVLDIIVKTSYSRYPIFLGKQDHIIGVLDVDDVLKKVKNKKLNGKVKNMARKVLFVPESKEIDDLLVDFEGKHVPMAIVVNEYGDVSGIVTVADILEEIVGDIFARSKEKSVYIKKVNDKLIRVDARISIEELNNVLHLGLKSEHFDTLAGFIEHHLKKIPKKGETIKLKNVTIVIDRATKQEIKKVKIIKL